MKNITKRALTRPATDPEGDVAMRSITKGTTTRTTITTTIAVTAMLLMALAASVAERARTTWRKDDGEILDFVVIAAGVVSLAIAVVAYIRPVVMRYLTQIQ